MEERQPLASVQEGEAGGCQVVLPKYYQYNFGGSLLQF